MRSGGGADGRDGQDEFDELKNKDRAKTVFSTNGQPHTKKLI